MFGFWKKQYNRSVAINNKLVVEKASLEDELSDLGREIDDYICTVIEFHIKIDDLERLNRRLEEDNTHLEYKLNKIIDMEKSRKNRG